MHLSLACAKMHKLQICFQKSHRHWQNGQLARKQVFLHFIFLLYLANHKVISSYPMNQSCATRFGLPHFGSICVVAVFIFRIMSHCFPPKRDVKAESRLIRSNTKIITQITRRIRNFEARPTKISLMLFRKRRAMKYASVALEPSFPRRVNKFQSK